MTAPDPNAPTRRELAFAVALGGALLVALRVWVGSDLTQPRGGGYWEPTLAMAGLAALGLELPWRRAGLVVLLAAALAATVLGSAVHLPAALAGERVFAWNQFHYYLGSKYLPEVGYFRLYEAVLAADERWQQQGGDPAAGWVEATRVRDMRTYSLTDRANALADHDAAAWSDERLEALGADSRWLQQRLRPDQWARVMKDLGYNPAPAWTILGRLGSAAPLGGLVHRLICASDALAMLAVAGALWWAFGWRPAALAMLWLHASPFNHSRLIGGFFNYDWLLGLVLGLAAWHRGRPGLAGAAWAWAAMTRVFPGLLAFPLLFAAVRGDRAARRFALVFVAVCGVLFVGSHGTGRGLQTWPEWGEKIRLHNRHHAATSAQRIGLGKLVRHQPTAKGFWRSPRRTTAEFAETAARRKALVIAAFAPLLLLGLRGRRPAEAAVGLLAAVWLLTVASRYYASVWVLLLLLPQLGPPTRAGPARVIPWVLLGHAALFRAPGGPTANYLVANYLAAVGFAALLIAWAWQNRRAEA